MSENMTKEPMATTEKVEGEFERAIGEGAYEWSIPSASDESRSYRMFVSVEADITRLICIEDSPVTSTQPSARRMDVEGEPARSVTVTLDEARWLLATLPKAIAMVESAWADEKAGTP